LYKGGSGFEIRHVKRTLRISSGGGGRFYSFPKREGPFRDPEAHDPFLPFAQKKGERVESCPKKTTEALKKKGKKLGTRQPEGPPAGGVSGGASGKRFSEEG